MRSNIFNHQQVLVIQDDGFDNAARHSGFLWGITVISEKQTPQFAAEVFPPWLNKLLVLFQVMAT